MRPQARFLLTAVDASQFPPPRLPEVAFLGRSNVGKSTLLNCLLGQKLAHTSSRPGRTQAINFFEVEGRILFVDLPGYGYAEAPKAVQRGWQRLIESYLLNRESLALCFVLIDARRGWMRSRTSSLPDSGWSSTRSRTAAVADEVGQAQPLRK